MEVHSRFPVAGAWPGACHGGLSGRWYAMNFLPVLKALPSVMEMASQLVGAARAARADARPAPEELANLERLAEQQAVLVQNLVQRVEELAAEVQSNHERLDVLNRRSGTVMGIAIAAASLAVTAAALVFFKISS